MKNKSPGTLRLIALFALLALSMMLTPDALAQENFQKFAPQVEYIPSSYALFPAPRVEFVSTRVEYDAKVEGLKGLKLHINFITRDPDCTPCRITAYFYDDTDDTALDGVYPAYTDAAGKVSAGEYFTPDIDPAQYDDFTLWIPYRALNLQQDSGNVFHLRYQLYVRDRGKALRVIGKSNFYPFSLRFK